MRTAEGRAALERYFARYVALAKRDGRGLVLESATWRSNPDWGAKLGYSAEALDAVNAEAIDFLIAMREREETAASPMVVSGNIGPRGDGYRPESLMSAEEAEAYHRRQVAVFAAAGADLVTVMTMTYPEEAIGVARAAQAEGMPVVVSFTVETDGAAALGGGARRGDRGLRRGDGRVSGLLHGQLRASDAFPRACSTGAGGWSGSAGSGRTRRR